MVDEIRIYVEGGGEGKDSKGIVRQGFSEFLGDLVAKARANGIDWKIVACGPRHFAYRNFQFAMASHPTSFNVLLVDAEAPVSSSPKAHLSNRDRWDLKEVTEEQCHLMIQVMETWFLADLETLETFYGQRFNRNPFPKNQNIEVVAKDVLESALKQATRHTTKGEYHKIRHGPKILGRLNANNVRKLAPSCNRLFMTLYEKTNLTI